MSLKKQVRKHFRDAVFKRDRYRCVMCGYKSSPETAEQGLDAHHITNRNEFPNGGYVIENGVSLCKFGNPSCHQKAEQWLSEGNGEPGYSPNDLYAIIGHNREAARRADNERY